LGLGVQAGVFLNDGGFAPTASAGSEEIPSPEVDPASFRESQKGTEAPAAVEKTRAPAVASKDHLDEHQRLEPLRRAPDRPVPEVMPKGSTKPLTVLVLGVDRRPSADEDSSTRSDTLMLVQLTPESGRVELLSVPRDLLVEVAPGVQDRINSAYAYGGVEQATAVMENFTGIPIDRYAVVDFEGFEDVVDAMGGMTLRVEQPIRVGIEGRRVYIPAGRQELNGLEALAYARYRGTPGGDLDRIQHQQRLLSALRQQALEWNTFTRLPRIVLVANKNVDTDLGIVQAISLGRMLVGRGGNHEMSAVQLQGTPITLPSGAQVLIPDYGANEAILRDFRE
jgi:LCP family protein required for cell wall assembly